MLMRSILTHDAATTRAGDFLLAPKIALAIPLGFNATAGGGLGVTVLPPSFKIVSLTSSMCKLFTSNIEKYEDKIDTAVETAITKALATLPAAAAKLFPVAVHTKLLDVVLALTPGTGPEPGMLVLAANAGVTANATGARGPHTQRVPLPVALPAGKGVIVVGGMLCFRKQPASLLSNHRPRSQSLCFFSCFLSDLHPRALLSLSSYSILLHLLVGAACRRGPHQQSAMGDCC